MTETMWLVLYAVASGAFGRLVKSYPKMPKGLLPWLVIGAGYAITFGMAIYGGAALADAAAASWTGVAAGVLAVGGHEALKPLLKSIFGEERAALMLGKLPEPRDYNAERKTNPLKGKP